MQTTNSYPEQRPAGWHPIFIRLSTVLFLLTLAVPGASAAELGFWQYLYQDDRLILPTAEPHAMVVIGDDEFAGVEFNRATGEALAAVGYFPGPFPATELKSHILMADGTVFTAVFGSDELMMEPSPDGSGHVYFFFLGDGDAELLRSARTWVIEVGGTNREYPLDGADYAIWLAQQAAAGELAAHEEEELTSQAEAWRSECLALASHPWDEQGIELGVAWGDIDGTAAARACSMAYDMGARSPRMEYLLGRALDKKGDPETVDHLWAAAEADYAIAFNHLGIFYRDKEYGLDDPEVAREMFRAAADRGNVPGRYNLSLIMIETGNNHEWLLGMRMLKAVADEEYPIAQRKFGQYLADGTAYGYPDLNESHDYYARAADGGDAPAAYRMAEIYRDGIGVDRDPEMYLSYLRYAAELGNSSAREELGWE